MYTRSLCKIYVVGTVLAPVPFAPGDMLVNVLHGKKDFAVVIKVTNQQSKVDYPELSGQPNVVTNF